MSYRILTRGTTRSVLVLTALAASAAQAAPNHVHLGASDDISWDQPRVVYEFQTTGGTLIGPRFDLGGGVLDTGANGVLVGNLGYLTENLDFDPDVFGHATRTDGSQIHYNETGVAGSQPFDLYPNYNLEITGDDGAKYTVPNVRGFGSMDVDLGSFSGVVGMPAMRGRVVTIDTNSITRQDGVTTVIGSTPEAPTAHSYRISLQMLPAEHNAPEQPGDPLPTFADLPLVANVTTAHGAQTSTNTILLDTGAQLSMISSSTAAALGINLDENNPFNDIEGTLAVGGIGGTVEAPLVHVDRISIPTEGGTDLVLTDLLVGVIDIPTIGGIFGMNILTSGQKPPILFGEGQAPGYFDSVELDFRNPTAGVMTLNVNPAYDVTNRTLTWAPGASTDWNAATSPFKDNANLPRAFAAGDYVRFDESAGNTNVNVSSNVAPGWVFVDATKNYTMSGVGKLTGGTRLTKSGTGNLRVQTLNDYTGPTDVHGGSITFAVRQSIGVVNVHSNASATFESSQRFEALGVDGTATLTPKGAGARKAIWTTAIDVRGRLDLGDGALIVHNTDTEVSSTTILAQIADLIRSARNTGTSGAWSGDGITSTSAAANSRTALGVILNNNGSNVPRFTLLGGEPAALDDVVVRYTYSGDADLDGTVGAGDFSLLASNFGLAGKSWAQGDFDYDGTVGPGDFSLLASNFGQALPGFTSNVTDADRATLDAFGATVPEPAATFALAMLLPFLGRRCRRST